MIQINERLVQWLDRQRELVAKLEASLQSLPAEQRRGQESVMEIMKEDIERVQAGAYSASPFVGWRQGTVTTATVNRDIVT